MEKDIVYFDLETQRTAADVGGWDKKCDMGMSIGVTFSTKTGKYHIYTEDTVQNLINQLQQADLVVGYNHVHFDYPVLMGYTIADLPSQIPSLDLMVDIEQASQTRPKLDAVAHGSLGARKTAEGLQAIRWWREGKLREIAEYCCFDVKVTKMVHEYGRENGEVLFEDRAGNPTRVKVDWG